MPDSSPHTSTPKRKRGTEEATSPIKFSFDPTRAAASEDGGNSPRSKVAHKFHGLVLGGESGGGAAATGHDDDDDDAQDSAAKRQRQDVEMTDGSVETMGLNISTTGPATPHPPPDARAPAEPPAGSRQPAEDAAEPEQPPSLLDPPSPGHRSKGAAAWKRSGTPPPRRKKSPPSAAEDDGGGGDVEIVEPIRAALTWHEDEITVYDPDDADDDGTGVNGVGFRPTPALAHSRLMRRRQQMAEYRRREEGEARARRSQRRRGGAQQQQSSPPEQRQAGKSRRVRFTEENSRSYVATTS